MEEAQKIMNRSAGYMVSFEWTGDGMLRSDHFPDKHAGEVLIINEELAWELAKRFAVKTVGRCVNIYVVTADFHPVKNYEKHMIINR